MNRGRLLRMAVLVTVIGVSGTAAIHFATQDRLGGVTAVSASGSDASNPGSYSYERVENPARTLVRQASGPLIATLTDGSRTVMLAGPSRTFREPKFTTVEVTTTAWVRLAPQPWAAGAEKAEWFRTWLAKSAGDTSPDIFAVAMQYIDSAAAVTNAKKLRVAGDATFGPDSGEGRLERSDFYDFLGVNWDFPDKVTEAASSERYGSLDCSGFVRMVYGYRAGYPLRGSNTAGPGLPRRAWAMSQLGPGTPIIADSGQRTLAYAALQPGDLLFFNLDPFDGPQIDHVGIYLGIDDEGHHRVLSSRQVANGPTFGDTGGKSLIDQGGKYSLAFRAAKRI
ncbi:C40 family peptidase [Amycolatopsis sp.]|uniref:C40 family peptidase n=1 Tax=Amycolatopsis sp. TaxID=37632 RepID=UPI002DFFE098|nr:NlpC/P60 family protein [Amycolatopsis sp.]